MQNRYFRLFGRIDLAWRDSERGSQYELLQRRLDEYGCDDAEEELNAIREILQDMILAGLARTDFFTRAAFHGGTQLRIFEDVRRFVYASDRPSLDLWNTDFFTSLTERIGR